MYQLYVPFVILMTSFSSFNPVLLSPKVLSVEPIIGAIAAGNAVVLKPSEISPATSSMLAKLLGEYMDVSAVKVIEGGVPETTALLEQRWDKILYTGNTIIAKLIFHVLLPLSPSSIIRHGITFVACYKRS